MARPLLSTVWSFNILFAVYLCHNTHDQSVIYTFNPYAKTAPEFWNVIQANYSLVETWTLLEHKIAPFSEFFSFNGKILLKK